MADEILSALITGEETISSALDDVEKALRGAAGTATAAATQFAALSEIVDTTEEQVDDLRNAFGGLAITAAAAGGVLEGTEDSIDDVGDQATTSMAQLAGLEAVMSTMTAMPDRDRDIDIDIADLDDLSRTLDIDTEGFIRALGLTDELGDEMVEAGAQSHILSEGMDETATSSVRMAGALKVADKAIDETGDEALKSAAELSFLQGTMLGVEGTGGHLDLGPLSLTLSSIAPVVTLLIATLGSLASALVGLAGASLGLAGVLGGALMGGLIGIGEQLAATSDEAETAMEGIQLFFERVGKSIKDALEPLQGPVFQDFALESVRGLVHFISDAAVWVERLFTELKPVIDALGESFWHNEPEVFAAMEESVLALMPALEDMFTFLFRNTAPAIDFFTDQALALEDPLADLSLALIDLGVELFEIGSVIVRVVAPAFKTLTDALAPALDMFTDLPMAMQEGVIAGLALITIFGPLERLAAFLVTRVGPGLISMASAALGASSATGALSAALGAISLPISGTVLAIGAAIGAIVAIMNHFGMWGTMLDWWQAKWNFFVEAVEFGANTLFMLHDALGPLAPLLMPGVAIMRNFGEIIQFVGGLIDWLATKLRQLADMVATTFKPLIDMIKRIDAEVGRRGGVDLSGFKAGGGDGGGPNVPSVTPSGTGGGPRGGGRTPTPGRAGGRRPGAQPYQDNTYNITVEGASAGQDAAIQQAIREAIRQANDEERRRSSPWN